MLAMEKPIKATRASKRIASAKLKNIKKASPTHSESDNSNKIAKIIDTTEIKIEKMDNSTKFVGAHVSISGGISKAVQRAVEIGAKSFALFLKSNHQWASKPIATKEAITFKNKCIEHNFPPQLIVPHGSYLLNCGAPNEIILEKSRKALIEEIHRCEALGLTLFNFHPGSSCGLISQKKCIDNITVSINMALEETSSVTILLENMCGQGNTIGGQFEELKTIIDGVHNKARVGICLDTCHAFAAGYDLACAEGFEKMMADFQSVIGLNYLKAVHLNDSMGAVGSHLDRHANIGHGHIGIEGFRRIMNDSRLNGMPMVLETPPILGYAEEIKILNSLQRL